MLLKFKKDRIVDKIDKTFSLLLEFLILFVNKITLCYSCNIITRSKSTSIKFKNFLIALTIINCLIKNKDQQVL